MKILNGTTEVGLSPTECCSCGVVFAVPEVLMAACRESGVTFYCPNGHQLCFSNAPVPRLKKELADAQEKLAQARKELTEDRCSRLSTDLRKKKAPEWKRIAEVPFTLALLTAAGSAVYWFILRW